PPGSGPASALPTCSGPGPGFAVGNATATADVMAPPDPLVREPRAAHRLGVEEVAAVDHQRVRHPALDRGPVELGELGPLGDEDGGVDAIERVDGGVAELNAREELARDALGDGVVAAHGRALTLEAGRENEARRLAHVVGVWLEGEPEQRDLAPDERAEVLRQ